MKLEVLQEVENGVIVGTSYWFWCPACDNLHRYSVRVDSKRPSWSFDGDLDKPSFQPSLLVFTEHDGVRSTICHLFLTDGVLKYCSDCPHKLSGQSIDLPDIPDEWLG